MQSQERTQTPVRAASQVRRIQATDRKIRKLEKSSDSAQTQGFSQQSCQSSAQTLRLSPAKTASATRDKSARLAN